MAKMLKTLRIKLESDCLPGSSGNGAYIDADCVFDSYGFPIILGKRLKGCFRSTAQKLCAMGYEKGQADIDVFFGTEKTEGSFRIGNAQIEGIGAIHKRVENARSVCANKEDIDFLLMPDAVEEFYTYVHTRTAIGDDGVAKEGSLRTVRALRKGLVFECDVEYPAAEQEFVEKIVKALRYIGSNRNRGFGRVNLSLTDARNSKQGIVDGEDGNVLQLKLRLKSPVLVDEMHIPGVMIRGALASCWMKEHAAPESGDYADCKTFRNLFVDGLCYEPAYPTDAEGTRYYPVPASVVRYKVPENAKCEYVDVAIDKQPLAQTKRITGGVVYAQHPRQNRMYLLQPIRKEFMHHSQAGKLFSYSALAEGERYLARISGEPEIVRIMADFIEENVRELHIGKSRSAQYGCVEIEKVILCHEELQQVNGSRFAMTLQTPAIVIDEEGTPKTDCKSLLAELEKKLKVKVKLTMERCFSVGKSVEGYNPQWKLSKQPVPALDASTTVVFAAENRIELPEHVWIGQRNQEGYGLVHIREAIMNDIPERAGFDAEKPGPVEEKMPETKNEAWSGFLKDFKNRYIYHQLRMVAMNDPLPNEMLGIKENNEWIDKKNVISSRTLQRLYALSMNSSTTWDGLIVTISNIKDPHKREQCNQIIKEVVTKVGKFQKEMCDKETSGKIQPPLGFASAEITMNDKAVLYYLSEMLKASILKQRKSRKGGES